MHRPPPKAANPRFVGWPNGEKRRIGATAPNKKIARKDPFFTPLIHVSKRSLTIQIRQRI